jgi:hypothetical protein
MRPQFFLRRNVHREVKQQAIIKTDASGIPQERRHRKSPRRPNALSRARLYCRVRIEEVQLATDLVKAPA